MYAAIQNKFSEALASKALTFTESTEIRRTLESGIDVIYTLAPALAKKPQQTSQDLTESKPAEQPSSPWLPPDESLVVKKDEDYTVVLNKFALAKYHFLLVSNEFQKQTLPLSEADLEESFKLLRQVNKESGKRHLGFYNSGSQSGASIQHRHIQFMTMPDNFRPFPDSTKDVSTTEGCTGDERVPFAHYIAGLPRDADGETLALRYSEVLGKVLTTISRATTQTEEGIKRPEINYNLVFTEEWMMATPRKLECTESGISINSLGTVGIILAKSDEQLQSLEQQGLDVIRELGYAFEEVKELRPDHTGYTHY